MRQQLLSGSSAHLWPRRHTSKIPFNVIIDSCKNGLILTESIDNAFDNLDAYDNLKACYVTMPPRSDRLMFKVLKPDLLKKEICPGLHVCVLGPEGT